MLWAVSVSLCQAQLRIKSYEEAKSQTWGAENPMFTSVNSDRFKNQDAVILGIDLKAEYNTNEDEINSSVLARKQILINSRPEAMGNIKFSELWPEFLPRQLEGEIQFLGLRIQKPSGSPVEIKVSKWQENLNLTLAAGDILDAFVYSSEVKQAVGGHIFKPMRLYNQYIYPIVGAKYSVEISKECYFIVKSYNDATKFKNKQTPKSIIYTHEFNNSERHPVQTFSPFLRTCPTTLIEVSYTAGSKDFINSFVDLGTPGRAKHLISPKDMLRFFSDKVDKKIGGKLYYESLSKEWIAALKKKKITPKAGQTVFVTELYDYIRNRYAVKGEKAPYNKQGMIEAMSYTLTKSKVPHELYVVAPIHVGDAKELALYEEAILVIRFKEDRTLYISSFGENDNINDVPIDAHSGKTYLITISEKPEYQKIKPVPFPATESLVNSLKFDYQLQLSDSMAMLNLQGSADGVMRKSSQNLFISASNYWEQESKKFTMAALSPESIRQADSLRDTKIQTHYKDLTGKIFKIEKLNISKLGRELDQTLFEFESNMISTDLKIEPSFSLKPASFVHELPYLGADDNLARRGDIIFPAAGSYEYNFKIIVPAGYQFKAANSEKNVKNDVGEASFNLKNNGSTVEISLKYSFKNYLETPVYWPKVSDILKVIEEFKAQNIELTNIN